MGSGLVFCLFFITKADGMSIKIKRQKTRPDPIALKQRIDSYKGKGIYFMADSKQLVLKKEEISLKIKQ